MNSGVDQNEVSGQIVDAAMKVHTALGPGLLESAYEACLAYELRKRGLSVRTQMEMPICYEDIEIDVGYLIDMMVADTVVVELKVVESLLPIHRAQILSYLKLARKSLGLLLNIHVPHMKDGISRYAN